MRVLGIIGWSGAGKTTLIVRLIPVLAGQGLKVATVKHAHHAFDVDVPGKDSYEHRQAGACEVLVCSAVRWAQMHELRGAPQPTLAELLARISPCDLVLIEGFKREAHPKLEVFRPALGQPPLYPGDPSVVAVASDAALPGLALPLVDLNDPAAVARLALGVAQPLSAVRAALAPATRPSSR